MDAFVPSQTPVLSCAYHKGAGVVFVGSVDLRYEYPNSDYAFALTLNKIVGHDGQGESSFYYISGDLPDGQIISAVFDRYEAVAGDVRLVLLSAYDWQHNTLVPAPEPARAPWPCVEALARLERYCARRMKRLKTGVHVGTDFDLDTVRDLERYGFWPFDVEIA